MTARSSCPCTQMVRMKVWYATCFQWKPDAVYAEKFGEDVETWGLLGLIHDFDWEIHPTPEQHPIKGPPILHERGVSEDIIQDILITAMRRSAA